jgi:PDZ domain
MIKMELKAAAICILGLLCACTHIEGTRDKSETFQREVIITGALDSIAILPIQDGAGMPGLSTKIEAALLRTLQAQFAGARIVDASAVGSTFAERDLVTIYGQWRAGYEFTGILDPRSFEAISQAIGVTYLLVVHQPHLSREKIRGSDTGYTGLVADANNVWRTDLQFTAELIDTKAKSVAWKGEGHAEHIHSPTKNTDLGIVIINHHNAEIPEYVDEMVTTATRGLVLQIGRPPNVPSGGAPLSANTPSVPPQATAVLQSTHVDRQPPPAPRVVGASFAPSTMGIGVLSVDKDSAASRAGLRAGDLITHINGRNVAPLYWENAVALLTTSGSSVSVRLMGSNEERTITYPQ